MSKEAIEYYRTLADLLENQEYAAELHKKLDGYHENPDEYTLEGTDIVYKDLGIATYKVATAQKKLDDMQKRGVIPGTVTVGNINARRLADGNQRAAMKGFDPDGEQAAMKRVYEPKQATDVAGVRPIGAMIDEYQPGDVPKAVEEMDVGKSLGYKRSFHSAVSSGDWSKPRLNKGVIYPIYFIDGTEDGYFIIDEEGNHHETGLRDTQYYWVYSDKEVEMQAQRFADDQIGGEAID